MFAGLQLEGLAEAAADAQGGRRVFAIQEMPAVRAGDSRSAEGRGVLLARVQEGVPQGQGGCTLSAPPIRAADASCGRVRGKKAVRSNAVLLVNVAHVGRPPGGSDGPRNRDKRL